MSGRIVFILMVIVVFFVACEDPNTLSVSKTFSGNSLQTVYMDTFSVITSTVQLDTVLTNGTGTVLVGSYKDDQLGTVTASSYFQIGYDNPFLPTDQFVFDSLVLILPYNHQVTGDTTKSMNLNVYQLAEIMQPRTLPATQDIKLPIYNRSNGFYNCSTIKHAATPIVSANVTFFPHRDSIKIRFPYSFGANWFRLAQKKTKTGSSGLDSVNIFSDVSIFANYFYGLHLNVDPGSQSCVVGFKAQGTKLRMYYKRYYGDALRETHTDFVLASSSYQFNNIQYDRTGTTLAPIQLLAPYSSQLTQNTAYIQTGTGLVTRLDFPSLKDFFAININAGLTLNAAYLEIYPLQGTYPHNLLPPSSLQLFNTDISSMPLSAVTGVGAAGIQYDYEYGLNTLYRYNIFSYIFTQAKANTNFVSPLILAPGSSQGQSVQRVYIGDRFHPINRIKLKIFYTYVPN